MPKFGQRDWTCVAPLLHLRRRRRRFRSQDPREIHKPRILPTFLNGRERAFYVSIAGDTDRRHRLIQLRGAARRGRDVIAKKVARARARMIFVLVAKRR